MAMDARRTKTVRFDMSANSYITIDQLDEAFSSPDSSTSSWIMSPDTSRNDSSFDSNDSPSVPEWNTGSTETIIPNTVHSTTPEQAASTLQQTSSPPHPSITASDLPDLSEPRRTGAQRAIPDEGILPTERSASPLIVCDELAFRETVAYRIDLRCVPSASPIHHRWHCPAILDNGLTVEATSPGLDNIVLVNRMLPWIINIVPSSGGVVTVSDILGGLHRALFTPVKDVELKEQTAEREALVFQACKERVARRGDPSEHPGGVIRRIDFLEGRTQFVGLSRIDSSPHVLQFNVRRYS